MSAKNEMLRRIKAALTAVPSVPEAPEFQRSLPREIDIVALMVNRLEDYKAIVVKADGDVPSAIAHALLSRGIRSAVIDPALSEEHRPNDVHCVEDQGLTSRDLDAIPAAITTCTVAVAETGTIMLTHNAGEGRRAISLIPDVHVCILRRDQIVGTVPEAVARIERPRISTWISGPSATSDIELNRVEGVHGPRTLIVLLV